MQAAVQAYVEGFNNRELTSFHAFFATTAQGADAAGLAQTLDAANQALNDSQAGDQFQLQNFQITSQRIDEQNNAAVVHYLASVAIVRNETDAVFAATVEQDVALILVDNQWLISGGDAPQITPTVSATLPGG
ncbi:MAG: hypothetical protein KC519_07580 [Anaerolineae bacterium]|nr:hypothetical protein [Anaerolineae bacterium]